MSQYQTMDNLYSQCMLVARTLDSPAHIAAMRQAFVDTGAVPVSGLPPLEGTRHGRPSVQRPMETFYLMMKGMGSHGPPSKEIERVFKESNLVREA